MASATQDDSTPLLVSILAHALIIAILLYVRLAPVDLPGVPEPIAISILPPETNTPTDTSRIMSSGMPSRMAATAATPAPVKPPPTPVPAQSSSRPVMSVPNDQATQSEDFPSAALLHPFNPLQQSNPTAVEAMQAPPLVLEAPPAETDNQGQEASPLDGHGGMPGTGPTTDQPGGIGKLKGAGTAGRGNPNYQYLILAIDQVERDSSIEFLKQFTMQLEQCGLTAVKSEDKSWLLTVRVIFDPKGNLYQATVVNPPAQPSEAYQTALNRLMGPLQTPGCNHLNLPFERPTWHGGTIYFYPKGNPSMPNEMPDGRLPALGRRQ